MTEFVPFDHIKTQADFQQFCSALIAAERERCAKAVEAEAKMLASIGYAVYSEVAEYCAAAIRNQEKKE